METPKQIPAEQEQEPETKPIDPERQEQEYYKGRSAAFWIKSTKIEEINPNDNN